MSWLLLLLWTDCGIVSSRLQVNLDDLLWVLTDSQMKAALGFVNSLRDVIKKSNQQSKKLAAEKLRVSQLFVGQLSENLSRSLPLSSLFLLSSDMTLSKTEW